MKILSFLIFNILLIGTLGISEVFAAGNDHNCVDKVWMESEKGRLTCVTQSTAEKILEKI